MDWLRRLIHEVHRRSLWQVLGIYGVASWAVLQVVDVLAQNLSLPGWFPPLAFALLLLGLPVVLATAFVQTGGPSDASTDRGAAAAPATGASVDPRAGGQPAQTPAVHRLFTWRNAIGGGVLAMALWGVIAAGWLVLGMAEPGVEATAVAPSHSLAALPFDNLSASAEDGYFADGIHEEVLSHLARLGGVKLISRTSVLEYRDTRKNVRTIAEELGVDHILEGSVRRAGNRVRITTQLIDARTDVHLWAEQYDREYTAAEVFSIQSDVARRIADALQATLTPATRNRLDRRPTESIEAYDLYLRALDHVRSGTRSDRQAAVTTLRRAVELDPGFALAWAKLAIAEAALYWFGDDRRSERVDLARTAAERALALDPDLPEAHLALGYYHYWGRRDYARALEEMRLAEPGMAGALDLVVLRAAVRRRMGDFEGAAADFATAFELDPRSVGRANNLGQTLWTLGRFEEALRIFDRGIALDSMQAGAYANKARSLVYRNDVPAAREVLENASQHLGPAALWQTRWWLELLDRKPAVALEWARRAPAEIVAGQYGGVPRAFFMAEAYHQNGQAREARIHFDSARAVLESMQREQPENETAPANLAWVYARLGRKDDAIRMARRAVELMSLSVDAFIGPAMVRNLAAVYAAVGEIDAAVDELTRLEAAQPFYGLDTQDPVWDPIRDHAGFRALASR